METGGFIASTDAILEIAATMVRMDEDGVLSVHRTHDFHVQPFEGANIEQSALDFTGIDPYHPFREAVAEEEALADLFRVIRKEIRDQGCSRAILVGHNAHFDAGFINAAVERCEYQAQPVPPLFIFRHRDPVRAGLRPDRVGQGLRRGGHRLRQQRGPLRRLRRGAHCGAVLRYRQPLEGIRRLDAGLRVDSGSLFTADLVEHQVQLAHQVIDSIQAQQFVFESSSSGSNCTRV